MQVGLYEKIINQYLENKLNHIPKEQKQLESLHSSDSAYYLSQYLSSILEDELEKIKPNSKEKIIQQIKLCNEILFLINSKKINGDKFTDNYISSDAHRLFAIFENSIKKYSRPQTPLAMGALLTGTNQDPTLVSQLKKEILSSDKIDILCSFIKWSGIRIIKDELEEFTKNNHHELRVITTSYMGATELKAIEFLKNLPNTNMKISYDTQRERLHAKSYLFYRKTGFSCAYIGSSNLSFSALTDGLEWNVKISQYEQPYQWNKIRATFDTYWNDRGFLPYETDSDRTKLSKALKVESPLNKPDTSDNIFFNLSPYPFQQEILDAIDAERKIQKKNKHLIIAATGTGKTMIAAFDFRHYRKEFKEKYHKCPKLLFIAHRNEILKQSLGTFRQVLKDNNFGGLTVGTDNNIHLDNQFVSIQSYNSKNFYNKFKHDHFDYIIIDEFHHAEAPSYRKMLTHVTPKSLIGLTATPERADNLNILKWFENHITAEIRLPDAINRKLLSPFQYFGISDNMDYSKLKWQRGGYIKSDLNNLYTKDDRRTDLIIEKTKETVLDIKKTRALGFCVSKIHAEYMAKKFNQAGIESAFLTSDSNMEFRSSIQNKLLNFEINIIFVVDLYNEGVDIPEIDTVLFLRPTESLTIFLQQLGRGLRISENKDCLTVLDFVGQAHKNYRFDIKYKALMKNSSKSLDWEINNDFPHLPAGCNIQFERVAKEYVLKNIKQSINVSRKSQLIDSIKTFEESTNKPLSFENFINEYKLNIDDVYKKKISWSRLLYEANLLNELNDPDEDQMTKGLRRIQHIDDYDWIKWLIFFFNEPNPSFEKLNTIERRYLLMLHLSIWGRKDYISLEQSVNNIKNNPYLFEEFKNLLHFKLNNISHISPQFEYPHICPLKIHSKYTRDEILAGLDYWTTEKQKEMREGTIHIKHMNTDVFFVTLNKNEKAYSPTTMYNDYAINDKLFHWQSQSYTTITSKTGQRYLNQKKNKNHIFLFVRENKSKNSLAQPYYFLGPVNYISHEDEKPINIIWELEYSLPGHLIRKTQRLSIN